MKLIGVGSYGEVVQAKHKASGQIVAIKLIKNILRTEYETKKIVREIQILRHFSQMKNNHFTTKILDIISPNSTSLQINHIFIVLEFCWSAYMDALENFTEPRLWLLFRKNIQ
jgi:serine/threonine protein kinase